METMQTELTEENFMNAVRIASAYQEQPIKEWLMENLGDKYSDDIDTIIIYGTDHKNEVVGKYNISTSSFIEKNKIVAFKRDSFPIQIKPIAPEPSNTIFGMNIVFDDRLEPGQIKLVIPKS